MALLSEYVKKDLIKGFHYIRHLDQLKSFNPDYHQFIIIDDCSLPDNRNGLLNMFEFEMPSAINVKFDVITIPKNIKCLFIANYTYIDFLKTQGLENDPALLRRIKSIHLTQAIVRVNTEICLKLD